MTTAKTFTTTEGHTFTPWTNGRDVGYLLTSPNRPSRYVSLTARTSELGDLIITHHAGDGEPGDDPDDVVDSHTLYECPDPEDLARNSNTTSSFHETNQAG